ncbi:MAG: outer membrane lipoprotein carrier protein LolA [Candidatus Eisenbacteria bacterium]|nr:outer membrane lipoprotein carrier protein LolA [Candidatus Eisenbacteria bacterium]
MRIRSFFALPARPRSAALLVSLFLCAFSAARGEDAEAVLARLRAAQADLVDLSATFVHTKHAPLFDEEITSRGRLFYRRPDLLLLRYEEPDSSRVWIDGGRIWLYYPELKQAHLYAIDPESTLPGLFLGLRGTLEGLEEKFLVETEDGAREKGFTTDVLILRPQEGTDLYGEVDHVRVVIRREDGLPLRTEFQEASGDLTRFTFDDFHRNPGLDESIFRFVPPPGTEVFESEGETW